VKKSTFGFSALSCFLIYALLCYPSAMLAASAESIRIWLTKVFPSLFPFAAACGILLRMGTAERLSIFFRPVMKILFGLKGISAFPFFLGSLSGYPMGAKLTAQLYETKQITLPEAQHILVFSGNPGPLFLIGTIGAGFFGMPIFGYLLFASCFLAALLTGMLWRFRQPSSANHQQIFPCRKSMPLTEALSLSVSDAVDTLLLIGGYMIFFSAVSEAMKQTGTFSLLSERVHFLPFSAKTLQGICSGLLEMTNGAYLLSQSSDALRLRLSLVAFLVSFGGLSVLGQTFGVLSAVPISKKDYLKGKAFHALSAVFSVIISFRFSNRTHKKQSPCFSLPRKLLLRFHFYGYCQACFFLAWSVMPLSPRDDHLPIRSS